MNEIGSEVAELYLYGTIREAYPWDEEEDCISAKRVMGALKELKGKPINVHINSGGGDVFESIAIGTLLKQHGNEINIYVDGLAGSGASIIAMAGKNIFMPSNSMMMIHQATVFVRGNADGLRKVADDLDKIDSSVIASYKERFVGTDEELSNLVKAETWLTAEECKALGFCNEIPVKEEVVPEPLAPESNIRETLFNKYSKKINTETQKQNLFKNFTKTKGVI